MNNIDQKIYRAISTQFNVPLDDLKEETSFKNDLNADSLDLVELIMALETELGIEAENDDLENIETIGDCLKFVENNVK